MDVPTLPEYESNPFISKLPPIRSVKDIKKCLKVIPDFSEKEREYPSHIRKHCVLRLTRFFEPLERPIRLFETIDMMIRQGYIGRNPLTTDFVSHLLNGAERIEQGTLDAEELVPMEITAFCIALLGISGIGKTKSVASILRQFPQVVLHDQKFCLQQIVWLKLECPTGASPKQLCLNFFASVDELLGTKYLQWYGKESYATGKMVTHMAQIASLHAIGVLVIDEIQNLKSPQGSDDLMKFLLLLVNKVSIPIVFVGNMSSVPILQGTLRNARRSSGLGSLIWDRFPPGETWNYFVDRLWYFQWTKDVATLTPEIRDVLYDESQGIVDILIKLLVLAQLRLIAIAEVRDIPERITPELLRRVAKDDFKLIQPMIKALRENDEEALKKFDDLTPFHLYFSEIIASKYNGAPTYGPSVNEVQARENLDGSDAPGIVLNALRAMGIAEDVAVVVLEDARKNVLIEDPIQLMTEATKLLSTNSAKGKKPKQKKLVKPEVLPENDLRKIVKEGDTKELPAYEALVDAGIIRPLLPDFAM
ncbi:MAG TPA: ATP-binding protein [Anaerolineales bacterium]|nr:ATP-binding protein [Anaerolineales bacterium]